MPILGLSASLREKQEVEMTDTQEKKKKNRTEATSSTWACAKRRALSDCCCLHSIAWFSFWVVAYMHVKPGTLSIMWYIWSLDYKSSVGSKKTTWKKATDLLEENTGGNDWGNDPSESNTLRALSRSTEQSLFPQMSVMDFSILWQHLFNF